MGFKVFIEIHGLGEKYTQMLYRQNVIKANRFTGECVLPMSTRQKCTRKNVTDPLKLTY